MTQAPPGTHPDTAAEVKAQLERLGLSQVELARRLGVHEFTVSRWTNGASRPSPATLRALRSLRKRKPPKEQQP